jgi:hypothetical protein
MLLLEDLNLNKICDVLKQMSLFFVALFILNVIVGVCASPMALASWMAVPPGGDWKVLQTPHFEIIFNAEQRRIAETYASEAESALTKLHMVFTDIPDKTVIVLDDTVDWLLRSREVPFISIQSFLNRAIPWIITRVGRRNL